jgi:hypothetical protein
MSEPKVSVNKLSSSVDSSQTETEIDQDMLSNFRYKSPGRTMRLSIRAEPSLMELSTMGRINIIKSRKY